MFRQKELSKHKQMEMERLHNRSLEREKMTTLQQVKGNYGGWMNISRET